MPYLKVGAPLELSATVTRSLRNRTQPLLDQLISAEDILHGQINTYLPRKEEWLLEWLVDRLKEDGSDATIGDEVQAQLSPAPWRLLYRLLSHPNTNHVTANAILRKHNFLHLLSKTFTKATVYFHDHASSASDIDIVDADVPELPMKKVHRRGTSISNASSSATEPGSPVLKFFTPRASPTEECALESQMLEMTRLTLSGFLNAIFQVVEYLQGQGSNGYQPQNESNKRRKLENTTPLLRGTPEVGAGIMNSYFYLLSILRKSSALTNPISEALWSACCFSLWKSCTYGNSNFKKLSATVSSQILRAATILLAQKDLSKYLQAQLESLLSNYIFQTLKSSGNQAFESLTKDISVQDAGDIARACPSLLKIALNINATALIAQRQRQPSEESCSAAFKALLPLSLPTKNIDIVGSMLDIVLEAESTLDDGCINSVLSLSLDMTSLEYFHCGIVRRAAQLNTDAVLQYEGGIIYKFLGISGIGKTNDEDGVWGLTKVVIDGHVRARDLGGFLETWLARSKGLAPSTRSVWTSDRLQELVAEQVDRALNANQICKILPPLSANGSFSAMIVADCVLRGLRRPEIIDKIRASGVCDVLTKHVSSRILSGEARWIEWRLLVRIFDIWGLVTDEATLIALVTRAKQTMESIGSARQKSEFHGNEFIFVLELLLVMSMEQNSDDGVDVDLFLSVIEKHPSKLGGLSGIESCDGSLETQWTSSSLLAVITVNMGRWGEAINGWKSESRERFLTYFLERSTQPTNSDGGIVVRKTWDEMIYQASTWDFARLKDSLIIILVSQLPSAVEDNAIDKLDLILTALAACPLEALRKPEREKILDILLPTLANSIYSKLQKEQILTVMVNLMEIPNNGAALASQFDADKGLGIVFSGVEVRDGAGTPPDESVCLKMRLARKVLGHLIATKDQAWSKAHLENLLRKTLDVFTTRKILNSLEKERDHLALIWIILTELWKPYQSGEKAMKSSLHILRHQALKNARKLSEKINRESDVAWCLQVVREVLELDLHDEATLKGVQSWVNELLKIYIPKIPADEVSTKSPVLEELSKLQCVLALGEEEVLAATALLVSLLKAGFPPSTLLPVFETMLERIDRSKHRRIMDRITNSCLPIRNARTDAYLLMVLNTTIKTTRRTDIDSEDNPIWSFTYSQMVLALPFSNSFESFRLISDGLEMWIREKSFALDQSNIDTTFSAIAHIASRACTSVTCSHPDDVFIPLCNMIRSIITIHRRRIRGRLHLVTNTLISLLLCLFKPRYTYKQSTKLSHHQHPHWLLQAYSRQSRLPTSKSAIAFSRILTTLYDPTAYSVGNRSGTQLTSSTAVARKSAGRHVTYVLLQFIWMQLNFTMDNGIRNALDPGLWVMFDVMDSEMLRKTNAALDGQGRVLFKALYEQWGKFGKWKE